MKGTARETQTGLPEIVGRYVLHREIASGGMASVHFGGLVGPVGFSRPVAIKRLHPHYARDSHVRAMFLDEARLVSRIRHPNVVPMLDVVATEGHLLLVMEYVHGESVSCLLRAARLRGKRVPTGIVLAIMVNVLHGLHAAHEARTDRGEPLRIVHRDVSPQNVMVGADGTARIFDFGIARAEIRTEQTALGQIKGKLAYMAPEQLGGTEVTRQADLYSTAVMLWEMLVGARLFFDEEKQTVIFEKLLRGTIEPPSAMGAECTPLLDAAVLCGLDREPSQRFTNAREMALALERAGTMASISEVSEWVESLVPEALAARAAALAEFEHQSARFVVARPSELELVGLAPERRERSETRSRDGATPASFGVRARTTGNAPTASTLPSLRPTPPPVAATNNPPRLASAPGPSRSFLVAVIGSASITAFIAAAAGIYAARSQGDAASGAGGATDVTAGPEGAAGAAVAASAPLKCAEGMALVGGGRFVMGSDDAVGDKPAHKVTLGAYCIDAHEVTTEAYRACSERGECKRAPTANEWDGIVEPERRLFDNLCNARDAQNRAKHPINCVDWDMANQFCQTAGKRLPSEAEWEMAARGTDGRRYPWGNSEPRATLVNACGRECTEWQKRVRIEMRPLYGDNDGFVGSAIVGSFPLGASPYGVDDMAGNVAEWVADGYADYREAAETDPHGPAEATYRVVRGGSFHTGASIALRATSRHRENPARRSFAIGFRCAKTPAK